MTHHDPAVRLLRETLLERAAAVDDAPPALPARPPLRLRGRRASLLGAAAAAMVAALAVTGVAAWRASRLAPSAPAVAIRVPAGWKAVASLGIEIYVPAGWEVTGAVNEGCVLRDPAARLVSRPFGSVTYQLCQGALRGTFVAFRPAPLEGEVPGRTVLADGRTRITWVRPGGTAAVVASGPDAAILQQVIDTARAVDVDALRCTTAPPALSWDQPRTGLPKVATDGVTDVVVCLYARDRGVPGYRLVASGRADPAQREAFVHAIGQGRAATGFVGDVVRPPCDSGGPDDLYTVVHVTAHPSTTLAVHWWGCDNRYVASPTAESLLTVPVIDALRDALQAWPVRPKLRAS